MASPPHTSKTLKLERYNSYLRRLHSTKVLNASSKLIFRVTLLIALVLILFFTLNYPPLSDKNPNHAHLHHHNFLSAALFTSSAGGDAWEKQVRHSSTPKKPNGLSVLVTGAAGFVGSHCSIALKKRGDGVLGLDNFNSYYDPSLKRARQKLLLKNQVFIVEGDLNDASLLTKLFDVVPFTHILHLAAQAGVRYAMQNPQSYVSSNIAGFVNLLEVAKTANPQPAIVWASSSSVYGLNTQVPFSELDRTDQPASLYAATKKAEEKKENLETYINRCCLQHKTCDHNERSHPHILVCPPSLYLDPRSYLSLLLATLSHFLSLPLLLLSVNNERKKKKRRERESLFVCK